MKPASCVALAEGDRIQFFIGKRTSGYKKFASVLQLISQNKPLSWYGDVRDGCGVESCGLILTVSPSSLPKQKNY